MQLRKIGCDGQPAVERRNGAGDVARVEQRPRPAELGVGEIGLVPTAAAVAGALEAFDGVRRYTLPMKDSPAARAMSESVYPVAMAAMVFTEQGAMIMPSVLNDPLAMFASMSVLECTTSARLSTSPSLRLDS